MSDFEHRLAAKDRLIQFLQEDLQRLATGLDQANAVIMRQANELEALKAKVVDVPDEA